MEISPPAKCQIARIAIPSSPLRTTFDYSAAGLAMVPGMRVQVSFRNKKLCGIVVECVNETHIPKAKLKSVEKLLDAQPVVDSDIFALLKWATDYYHYAIGEVFAMALPPDLRKGLVAGPATQSAWQVSESGNEISLEQLKRSPRQAELIVWLADRNEPATETLLNTAFEQWRDAMRRLEAKGWVEQIQINESDLAENRLENQKAVTAIDLNSDQQAAVTAILQKAENFQTFLLEGVTGSGKTEVYLELIKAMLAKGKQVLVLVPEISLTPQLTQRFNSRLPLPVEVLHSALTDNQRSAVWHRARKGDARVVVGTRSAITTPFPDLGLIIIDEEHDSSLKQQDGFRYSARDMAVMRCHKLNIPIVLGSATPSFESLHNVNQGRYQKLQLTSRYGKARPPSMQLVDMRRQPLFEGLSLQLLDTMRQHLARGNQVLLFINRRGYAPTLLCHDCGWIARCQRCDSHMTYHHGKQKLRCHHCGAERRAEQSCPECSGTSLIPVGEGTERVEQVLKQRIPDTHVVRIDRDTTRRKGSLENLLQEMHQGDARILVGTQMLAKGHHFPDVTLVGILNVDQGLFSVDFHALEKTAQLIVQVAGRAGREDKPGTVLIQTHYPEHPLLQTLLTAGYDAFARQALLERQQANLPPFSFMAILRAEAVVATQPLQFLQQAKELAQSWQSADVELMGPWPSPMEKRAGRFRAQLFVQSADRAALHQLLTRWVLALEKAKLAKKVRWSLDVDPVDVY